MTNRETEIHQLLLSQNNHNSLGSASIRCQDPNSGLFGGDGALLIEAITAASPRLHWLAAGIRTRARAHTQEAH